MYEPRIYQEEAIRFFAENEGRVLVSLPPGAGKTFTAMYTRYLCRELKHCVVVCPASIRIQWHNEWKAFFPDDKVLMYDPETSIRLKEYDCIIINYEKLGIKRHGRSFVDKLKADSKGKNHIDYLIIDECHFAKNADSTRGNLCYKLATEADRVMLLSGTPITNKVTDIWNQLRLLNPVAMGSFDKFKQMFCGRHLEMIRTRTGIRKVWKDDGRITNIEALKNIMSMFVFFRDDSAVFKEMPKVQRIVTPLEIQKKQLSSYFETVTKLKKANKSDNDSVISDLIGSVRMSIGLSKVDSSVKWISEYLRNSSDDVKLVVFGYHRKVVELLTEKLTEYNPVLVYGGMSAEDKNKAVQEFRNNPECRIFVGNIASAGTGLDGLNTVCNRCVFVEYSYSAAEQKQAEGRIRRTNSTYDKYISYYMFAEGTLDAAVFKAIDAKAKTSSELLENRELTTAELLSIIKNNI